MSVSEGNGFISLNKGQAEAELQRHRPTLSGLRAKAISVGWLAGSPVPGAWESFFAQRLKRRGKLGAERHRGAKSSRCLQNAATQLRSGCQSQQGLVVVRQNCQH